MKQRKQGGEEGLGLGVLHKRLRNLHETARQVRIEMT